MSLQRLFSISFGICGALALTACGAQDGNKNGTGGAAGAPVGAGGMTGGGAPSGGSAGTTTAADCMHIDYASYQTGDMISFKTDILPIIGFGCTASSCHTPDTHKAGLNLGWHCNYDMAAKWSCTFPTAPDPNSSTTKPDDDATVAAVYASMMAPATTVNGGAVLRVKPGDPANSFLALKLADQQGMKGYMCTNQDPQTSTMACGVSMPLNGDPYCMGTARKRFDAVMRWIAEGAPNN